MSTTENVIGIIKHLTMMLEDMRNENKELRQELHQVRGLLLTKDVKKLSDEDIARLTKEIQKTPITITTEIVKGSDKYGYSAYDD